MTSSQSIPASGGARLLLVAVLIAVAALVVPGLASAEPAAVADEVTTTAPAGPAEGAGEVTAPADQAPADQTPVDEAPADQTPAEQAPVEQAPVEEQPVAEAPATEAPAPPPATSETPAVPETEATPAPAPAPAVVETAPPPSASTLPATPDAPKPVVVPDKLPAGVLLPVVRTPPTPSVATPAVVAEVESSVPDAPAAAAKTTPAAAVTPPAPAITRAAYRSSAPLPGEEIFTLDPKKARSPVAPVAATTIERGPGMALGEEGESTLFSESASAPIGTVGSGSSLLAVLAGYVLPGVGGPPASTLIMFVLVGLIVAIARAPRPQLSERLHPGALLGAASGHGLAVCRPG